MMSSSSSAGRSSSTTLPSARSSTAASLRDVDPTSTDIRTGISASSRKLRLPGSEPTASSILGASLMSLIIRRSEEHTSELQSLMRISYAVFCLKKKKTQIKNKYTHMNTQQTIQTYRKHICKNK